MKKKIVAVLLASVMALSLSACGGSKTDSSSSKSDTKKEKTVKPDKKAMKLPLKILQIKRTHPKVNHLTKGIHPQVNHLTKGTILLLPHRIRRRYLR